MQIELKQLQREVGITFIYVTHDQEEALTMSDRIAVMTRRPHRAAGRPRRIYDRPAAAFVAGFIGDSNFLTGTLLGLDAAHRALRRSRSARACRSAGSSSTARPAQPPATRSPWPSAPSRRRSSPRSTTPPPSPSAGLTRVVGRVRQGTYLGDTTEYLVHTEAAGDLVVRRQNMRDEAAHRAIGPGEPVVLNWHEEANLILSA